VTTADPYLDRVATAIEAACERIVETRGQRRWLTVEEVGAELHLSPSRVSRLLRTWSLPVRDGGYGLVVRRQPGEGRRRRWLVCRHSLDRMVERHWI
jgi:hypothetical protein